MPGYYPIMLDVRNRQAIVIGGDSMAAEKAVALCGSGANVTVQSSEFCAEILAMAERGEVVLRHKSYEPGDLAGAFVVVAAVTYDTQLTEAIWHETQEHGQLVNIVDVPARCNFIVPSILRRGHLTIAVSTEGASPSLSKRIRHRLEGLFPAVYDTYMQLAEVARAHLRTRGISYAQRDDFFGDFFNSDILALLTEGKQQEAVAISVELLHHYGVAITPDVINAELAAIA